MRSLLRALVVIVAVTVAGTTLPSMADQVGPSEPAAPRSLASARAASPTPRPTPTPPARTAKTVQPAKSAQPAKPAAPKPPAARTAAAKPAPLRTVTIALDPGHQLGNRNYPRQTNALVPAGGFDKPCNTTGTATASGVPEATVNMALARAVERRLVGLGARVRMTRTTNSERRWGPCIDTRGQFGKRVGAQLMVSLHADGSSSSARGFHVIAPAWRSPWTSDIAVPSLRLAEALRDGLAAAGVPRADYVAGGTGLNVRSDLGTLNMSDVPVAMIEIGNMRNSGDARRMTSASGRARDADAVVRGIRTFLGR